MSCSCRILQPAASSGSTPEISTPKTGEETEDKSSTSIGDGSDETDVEIEEKNETTQVEFHGEFFSVAAKKQEFDIKPITVF